MWQTALLLLALAQGPVAPATVLWDLDPSHAGGTAELEIDGTVVPCGPIVVTATDQRCALDVPVDAQAFRLRITTEGGTSPWSPGIDGAAPGAPTILFHREPEPEPDPEPETPMAISPTHVTSWDGDTSGSITPGANKLILVAIGMYRNNSAPVRPTSVTGNGITYTFVGETGVFTSSDHNKRIALYRGMSASPSAGAITFSGGTYDFSTGTVIEVDTVNTGGTNGSSAVVQSAVNQTNAATSLTATLAAFADAGNGVVSFAYIMGFGAGYTPGSGFTELVDGYAADRLQAQWRADNDTTADVSWSGSDSGGIIAVEIAAAGGGSPDPTAGRLSFTELEVPLVETAGRLSFAELEVPLVGTKGRVSFAELEIPLVDTSGRLSFAELEVPELGVAPTSGQLSFAELEVPLAPTKGRFSWAELEVPFLATAGRLSFTELEVPLVGTAGRLSFTEFEAPALPNSGKVSWMELQVPELGEIRRRRFIMGGKRGIVAPGWR